MNPQYNNALQVLMSLGQIKQGDNVRIQEFTAVDTYVLPAATALAPQSLWSNSQTKNYPYRNITFPDTSRSYIFQRARADHDVQFEPATAGQQNWYLNSFQRYSTLNWVINGVQTPPLWLQDLMPNQFGNWWNGGLSTPAVQLQLQQSFQTWYDLEDPINLAAGVNAIFTFTPQTSLTTIAAFVAASTPYAPNTGVQSSAAACTVKFELNGFQWSVIS